MGTGWAVGMLACAAMAATSCGGGGPESPSQPGTPAPTSTPPPSGWTEGTVLTVVSGATDEGIAKARVFVAGVPRVTDTDGKVAVPAAAEGATVDVEANGFLARKTLVRHSATRLSLWPVTDATPEWYTRDLVYVSAATNDPENLVPLERLPPKIRTLALAPSEALTADADAMAAHEKAARYFSEATQGRMTISVGGSAEMTVPTRIDASEPSCDSPWTLMARRWVSSHEVTRAEIVFCSDKPTRFAQPILHEIGHVYGLGHSISGQDVMHPVYDTHYERHFTEAEVLTMTLIAQRRGGNIWPDNDRTATTSAPLVRVFVD